MRILLWLFVLIKVTLEKKKKKYERDDSVLVLNDKNFEGAIHKFKHVLVLFYATWCGHCKQFMPTFTKASLILKKANPKLNLAKIEMSQNKKTQDQYHINGYPTLKFFTNGIESNYTGAMGEKHIAHWVMKMSDEPFKELQTLAEIANFKNTHEVAIIYFGNDTNHIKLLQDLAISDADNFYARCDFSTAYSQYSARPGMIALYKNYGVDRTELSGKISDEGIKKFIGKYSINKIMAVSEKSMKIIWKDKNPALIFFRETKARKTDAYDRIITDVADKLYGRINVLITGLYLPNEVQLNEICQVRPDQLPQVRIYDTRKSFQTYYVLDKDITEQNILDFVSDWEKGKLVLPLRSQPIPKNQKGHLLTFVGLNFKQEVLNKDINSFILFYSPDTPIMSQLMPIIEELAGKMKEFNQILQIGKIDLKQNEIREFKISKYPTMKLFIKDNLSEPIEYKGDNTLNDIIAFIKTNLNMSEDIDVSLEDDEKKDDL